MSTTLAEFLLDRIAEDEELAQTAMTIPAGIERTVSVLQDPGARWQAFRPDGSPMPVHCRISQVPDATPDAIGDWGFNGGPPSQGVDDRERAALDAIFGPAGVAADAPYRICDSGLWDESDDVGATYYRATVPASAGVNTARHIATWSPLRVVAECKAKRRLIHEHDREHECSSRMFKEPPFVGCEVLRILALPYSDDPDYRQEWRP